MSKNVTPLAAGALNPASLASESTRRLIFQVGRRRFAMDLKTTISELRPKPADVVPIKQKRNGRKSIE